MQANGMDLKQLVEVAAKPYALELAGGEQRVILPAGWSLLPRQGKPEPGQLVLSTLTGFASYVQENRDGLELKNLLCHVQGPLSVGLIDKLGGEDVLFRRPKYAVASLQLQGFGFGVFVDSEAFIIALQVHFAPTPERDALLQLLANIRDAKVLDTTDNGYAQQVTAKAGVALVENVKVQNPVTLRPWRTFREVDQPASPFILRLKSGAEGGKPTVALFEADGGQWQLDAMQKVADWLSAALPKDVAVIA